MGGRKETPPTIIMPAEGAPQAFQTIVPQKSYKDIAESTLRSEKEINITPVTKIIILYLEYPIEFFDFISKSYWPIYSH